MNRSAIIKALHHPDILGAGAALRRKYLQNPKEKFLAVMKEYKRGTLRSGGGERVKKRAQAIAIALSEGRK